MEFWKYITIKKIKYTVFIFYKKTNENILNYNFFTIINNEKIKLPIEYSTMFFFYALSEYRKTGSGIAEQKLQEMIDWEIKTEIQKLI